MVPVLFLGLFDLLKQEKFSWKPILMAGIAAGLIGLTTPYYAYMTILMTVIFLLGFYSFQRLQALEICNVLEKSAVICYSGSCPDRNFHVTVSPLEFPE